MDELMVLAMVATIKAIKTNLKIESLRTSLLEFKKSRNEKIELDLSLS